MTIKQSNSPHVLGVVEQGDDRGHVEEGADGGAERGAHPGRHGGGQREHVGLRRVIGVALGRNVHVVRAMVIVALLNWDEAGGGGKQPEKKCDNDGAK